MKFLHLHLSVKITGQTVPEFLGIRYWNFAAAECVLQKPATPSPIYTSMHSMKTFLDACRADTAIMNIYATGFSSAVPKFPAILFPHNI